MKLGISTACFYNKAHVETTFEVLRKLNVDSTEVFLNTFSEYEKPFVDALVERADGIKIHSVHAHGTSFEPELFADYDRVRNEAEVTFRKVCLAGNALGAKYYTFHGPFLKANRPNNINWTTFSEKVNRLCTVAENYGISIAYENVNWAYGDNPEFFKKLFSMCPKLKATLDVKQALFADYDPLKFLDVMEERLVTVHLCDVDSKGKACMPGKGRYNFEKLLRELADRCPEINAFLEVYSTAYETYEELGKGYDGLNEIIDKILKL
ncbi:MAG: sugar phosphate isomerase/epimerase [Clostridia bacterium]|nr:sugar phosphate isomerase/epimerase [Clostridia bacterium]